jgi:hypothetical protein
MALFGAHDKQQLPGKGGPGAVCMGFTPVLGCCQQRGDCRHRRRVCEGGLHARHRTAPTCASPLSVCTRPQWHIQALHFVVHTNSTKLQSEEVLEPFAQDFWHFWDVVSNNEATVDTVDTCLKGAYVLGITQPRYAHLCSLCVHGHDGTSRHCTFDLHN